MLLLSGLDLFHISNHIGKLGRVIVKSLKIVIKCFRRLIRLDLESVDKICTVTSMISALEFTRNLYYAIHLRIEQFSV